jgi:membrane fusion protein (multidrug efflux system)
MFIPSPFLCRSLAVAVLGSLVLAACERPATAPAAGMPPAQVTVVTLKTQPVTLTRELPGRANASLVAEVRPQVNGIVKRRLFTEGGMVKPGQSLYQLDDATYQADLASAKAALARAQATLNTARLNAKRTAELVKIDAVSRQDNENATAALLQAEADVKAAQAAVQRNSIVLDYARISAPIGGRIGKSSVTQGALVTANQPTALATVQQVDPIHVDLTQSASELLQLRKELAAGTLTATRDVPVTILMEDGSRYPHPGKLAFADLSVDPATGSYTLRVTVPNPDQMLLPGMYLRAVVSSGKRADGVLVPQRGVTRDPKGNATAMVVNKDGKVESRQIKVSQTIGDQWLVESGLAAGDRVIVEGLQKIGPGMPVQASEAGPAAKTDDKAVDKAANKAADKQAADKPAAAQNK